MVDLQSKSKINFQKESPRKQNLMKPIVRVLIFLVFAFFGLPFISLAQIDAGPNDTINPGVPVTLTTSYGEIGTAVSLQDDVVRGPFPIGFTFHFFGQSYDHFYIGSNGWVSFSPNPNSNGVRNAFEVPNSDPKNPKNCIMAPWQDFAPSPSDSVFYVYYLTTGTQPERKLVVMWCQVSLFSLDITKCFDSLASFQIILHEDSNIVESQIYRKPSCTYTNSNLATIGLQNSTGFTGYAAPGRNGTSWTAFREGWEFIPTSVDSFDIVPVAYRLEPVTPGDRIQYTWYQGSDVISNSQSVTVTPRETTTYKAKVTLCDGEEFTDTVTVVVMPYIPNAFTPNGDGLNDEFRILGIPPENITQFNMQIYDRWGQQVFSSSDIRIGWDGSCRGELCPGGVYVWVIVYEDNKKHKVTNKGTLTLIR
jgi:gliding motility-associated-like protein